MKKSKSINNFIKLCKTKDQEIISTNINNNKNINDLNICNYSSCSLNQSIERIKNSNKFKKNNQKIENYGLIEVSNVYYSIVDSLKDFFNQLLDKIYCRCNKKAILEKIQYENKINKLLSINYIFKKFYMLEILLSKSYTSEQLTLYHKKYLVSMLNSKHQTDNFCYDDSCVFVEEKEKL